MGALADLKALCGARACACPIEAQAIEKARLSRELKVQGLRAQLFKLAMPLFKAKPAHIDELLEDGQVLPILGGLRVINTPGHTPGHISLYAPAAKILFCGDSMVAEKNGILRRSRGMNTWDEDKAEKSVKVQAALGAEIVCSGHGPVERSGDRLKARLWRGGESAQVQARDLCLKRPRHCAGRGLARSPRA